jgi:aldose 1-epimerase
MRITKREFGRTRAGELVFEYILEDPQKKLVVAVTTYGATITRVSIPDRDDVAEEITLNYENLKELEDNPGPYYGCVIGRFANRIKGGTFHLDGNTYQLAVNNGSNHLHGGVAGFDKRLWSAEEVAHLSGKIGVRMSYISADGEEGYPGELNVSETSLTWIFQEYFTKSL